MRVELGLIVTLYTKMALVFNQTLSELTVTMQLTAISKGRVKLKVLVTLQELPLLLHQIPAVQDVLTLLAPGATWCVCKEGSDTILQKTLDYACGAGADCNPLHQNGPCFQPNTVRAHCNYAVNSYFQRKGQAQGSCDFAGTATVTASDPSSAGCSYPASSSNAGTGTSSGTSTPSSPYSSTAGAVGDDSDGGLMNTTFFISFFSGFIIILFWCC